MYRTTRERLSILLFASLAGFLVGCGGQSKEAQLVTQAEELYFNALPGGAAAIVTTDPNDPSIILSVKFERGYQLRDASGNVSGRSKPAT